MRIVGFLALILLAHGSVAQDSLESDAKRLTSESTCEKRSAVLALYEKGEHVIPLLIQHIHDGEIVPSSTLILANPLLSSSPPGSQRDQFAGVIYAYIVELILARSSLSTKRSTNCTDLLAYDDYVYGFGLIYKGETPATTADLSDIQEMYLEWWQKNKTNNLPELRRKWKKKYRPLSKTHFRWL